MMRFTLPVNDGDDPAFLHCLEGLLSTAVRAAQPHRVYIARLDNWFGHRWYGFRGKLGGAVGWHNLAGHKLFIVPPFVPERVLSEVCYEESEARDYHLISDFEPLAVHQPSSKNFRRWVDRFAPSAVLFWYSGNSASRDMGSAMLYVSIPDVNDGWYLCLRCDEGQWRFHKGIEITKETVEASRADSAR